MWRGVVRVLPRYFFFIIPTTTKDLYSSYTYGYIMTYTQFRSKVSKMGDKKIINIPKAIEFMFEAGEGIVFYKLEDYLEEKRKFRSKNEITKDNK